MRFLKIMLTLFIGGMLLTACGSPVATTTTATTTTTTTPSSVATQLELSASPSSVNSDNSSPSTITATVLDASNAVVSDAAVSFSASLGQLSAATGTTDATGKVTVSFSSGSSNFNQIATITASLTGIIPAVTVQIPVQVVGTTVVLSSLTTNLTAAASDTLTITVKDSGSNPIANTTVVITQAGAGSVSIAPAVLTTDVSGVVAATVTGVTAGAVSLTVAAAGATASQAYTVTNPASAFSITAPAVDPFALSAGTPVAVTVQAPGGILNVTFAASLGVWNGGLLSTLTVPVAAGVATANFSSAQAGVATIQVFDALDIATTDKMKIAVSQPAANATQIALQSTVSVIAPSTGGLTNTVTFTATVRDAANQVVGGAPVAFSIPIPSGGGEFISPVVALTDSFGKVTTTFTSGAISTGAGGVDVRATLLNPPGTTFVVSNIVIGGTAGSVAIGRASEVVIPSPTVYELPMSVLVADSNGNTVAGATVSLKAFPKTFRTGAWVNASYTVGTTLNSVYLPCITGEFPNEDINRNLILDAGEDVAHPRAASCSVAVPATVPPTLVVAGVGVPLPANSRLDPQNSAAGTLPQTVITDASGVANFNLTYLKGSSIWIDTEVTASTLVLGSESTANISFTLPAALVDVNSATANMPDSVFGQ